MKILINNSNKEPIYQQIYQQIKSAILKGDIKKDEALPSIRLLAKELKVSNITSKRAYEELEKDGLIYSVVGKGSYVSPIDIGDIKGEALDKIREHLEEIIKLSEDYKISESEIIKIANNIKGDK